MCYVLGVLFLCVLCSVLGVMRKVFCVRCSVLGVLC